MRITLAAIVLLAGYQSFKHSLALALPSGQLERAYRLAPGSGQIAADLSERLSGAEATAGDRVRADRLARAALLRDPTAVKAAATLGIDALFRNEQTHARKLFVYSQKLSRRDLRTQLWAIEDAVGRGDMAQALRHYDVALRTKTNAQELLFPVLGAAIEEPAIRTELIRTLRRKPLWQGEFIQYVAGNGPFPRATARLLEGVETAGVAVPKSAAASVISGLINSGDSEEAWAYYGRRHPGADRRQSRDANFNGDTDNPSAFDWSTVNDMGLSASILRGDKDGLFDFAASPGIGGAVLQQMQLLPPGKYELVGRSAGIEQPAGALPYWLLNCRDGREIGRVAVPSSNEAEGRFSGSFVVPQGCPVQVLGLILRPSDAISGVAGQINQVVLRPAR